MLRLERTVTYGTASGSEMRLSKFARFWSRRRVDENRQVIGNMCGILIYPVIVGFVPYAALH